MRAVPLLCFALVVGGSCAGILYSFGGTRMSKKDPLWGLTQSLVAGRTELAKFVGTGVMSSRPAAGSMCSGDKPKVRGTRLVSIGSTFDSPRFGYAFFLPITCRVWCSQGVDVSVTLTGEGWDTPLGKLIVDTMRAINGTTVHFMNAGTRAGNLALSQVARAFAAFQEGAPCDAYVFTSDVDLIPLNLTAFVPLPSRQKDIGTFLNLYNGDCCWEGIGFEDKLSTNGYRGKYCGQVAMTSVGADAWLWRNLMHKEMSAAGIDISRMGHISNELLAGHILRVLKRGFGFDASNSSQKSYWSMDQVMLGCIAKSLNASDTPEFGRRGRLDVRSLPKATKWENQNPFDPKVHFRIDRARWPNALDWTKLGFLNGKHDVHLIRPGYLENWRSKIRPLFQRMTDDAIMPPEHITEMDSYHAQFIEMCKPVEIKRDRRRRKLAWRPWVVYKCTAGLGD